MRVAVITISDSVVRGERKSRHRKHRRHAAAERSTARAERQQAVAAVREVCAGGLELGAARLGTSEGADRV